MKWSKVKALIPTLKEVPGDAEIISHILMIRAGLIRKISAGLYIYLPLCLKVIRNIEKIIREEMEKKGAQELLMPLLQPRELWEKSGRWEHMGKEMARFKNRQDRHFVVGPTHEEVITDLVSREIKSYRDAPCNFYQIQVKVRDEIRPRFGVIRAKEFIMKDAYSFHTNDKSLDLTFNDMFDAYANIFKRAGLEVMPVDADTGMMGGTGSIEFIALSESGEDRIAMCTCGYAANLEKAQSIKDEIKNNEDLKEIIKTLFYLADSTPVCVLLRGDDNVNEVKLKNYLKAVEIMMLDDETIEKIRKNLKNIKIVADYNIKVIKNAVTIDRDFSIKEWADIIEVKENETCPKCKKNKLKITSGIELGHIFKLGQKYTNSMQAKFLDQDGKEKVLTMGCYGIGVSRMVAAVLEQHNDKDGIIWPKSIAPYDIHIVLLNSDDKEVVKAADELYDLLSEDFDVLLDDRDERPGFKFKDADLLGMPLRVVVSSKNLKENELEIKVRSTGEVINLNIDKGSISQNMQEILNRAI